MFHNENNWLHSQRDKSKKHKLKKLCLYNQKSVTKPSKSLKASKQRRRNKPSKIKHVNTVSDYVGPERLTKHVGFFTKGKISNSISRIEKNMPKDVKARARQDLKEVLKLSCSVKNKCNKKHKRRCNNTSSKEQSIRSSLCTPHYLYKKTGFASNLWKDKLQRSVGLPTVNSILDSVHEPLHKSSPIEEPQLIARKLILTTIHPLIKEANDLLFSNISHKDKLKEKLHQMKNQLQCDGSISESPSCCSCVQENSEPSCTVSLNNNSETSVINNSQNAVKEDFSLNPIFIGESIVQNDIANIFPPEKDFIRNGDLVKEIDFINLSHGQYDSEINSIQTSSSIGKSHGKFDSEMNSVRASSSAGKTNSVTLRRNSSSSEDSPVWKLKISPVKFVPELGSTPTLYFRHKMF